MKGIQEVKSRLNEYWESIKYYIRDGIAYVSNKYFLLAFLIMIIDSLQPFINALLPKYIIDELMNSAKAVRLFVLVGVFLVSVFLLGFIKSWAQKNTNIENEFTIKNMEKNVSRKCTQIRFECFEKQEIINLSEKARRSIGYIGGVNGFISLIRLIISSVITICGFIYLIFDMTPLLIFIMPFCILVNPIISSKINKLNREYYVKTVPQDRQYAHYFGNMIDFKYGKDVRIFGMQNLFVSKAEELSEQLKEFYNEKSSKVIKLNCLKTAFEYAQLLILYGYIIYNVLNNQIAVSDFVMCVTAVSSLSSGLGNLINSILTLCDYARQTHDYYNYMQMSNIIEEGITTINDIEEIRFENLYFKYPDADEYVLQNINFTIRKGERIALVGLNGAGKSTLVKLLLRFYQPSKGCIYVNNINIENINHKKYISLFSTVFQDFQLFATSVEENITLSQTNELNHANVKEVIGKSDLDAVIERFPHGIMTQIYKLFTNDGIVPSGGEAQKIAIARAIYKESQCIILDEPTAALDPISEYELYCHFNEMINNKTSIYISHRLASCRFCDRIIVIHNGCVFEKGTHNDLVKKGGLYAEMFNKQLEYYQ